MTEQDKLIKSDKYFEVDFEGNDNPVLLDIQQSEEGYEVFDNLGVKIPFNNASPLLNSSYKVVKLNQNSDKEYLQWDNNIGPHQTQTFFYTMFEGDLQALPVFDFDSDIYSFAFYNSRNELGVGDFTSDGLMEVVENVDEMPIDAPQLDSSEIEDTVRETFKKEGISEEEIQNWVKIAKRENYGKGRGGVVIWSINSFVESETPFFRKLRESEYNEISDRYISAMNKVFEDTKVDSKLLKVDDLSQDSIDFNYFVRDFWTHGNNFEFPIEK